jgi:hypothetical protein
MIYRHVDRDLVSHLEDLIDVTLFGLIKPVPVRDKTYTIVVVLQAASRTGDRTSHITPN